MTLPRAIKLIDRHVRLRETETVLDFGCGDQASKPHFENLGYAYTGWDIAGDHAVPYAADLVNLSYVLNVLGSETARTAALKEAWSLANSALLITLPPGFSLTQVEQFEPLAELNDARNQIAGLTAENLTWIENVTRAETVPLSSDVFLCLRGSNAQDVVTHRQTGLMRIVPALIRGTSAAQSRRSFLGRVSAIVGGIFALGVTSRPVSASDNGARVRQVVMDQLGLGNTQILDGSSLIEDFGADSLDLVELSMALEEEFNTAIPSEEFERMETVGDIINYINQMTP